MMNHFLRKRESICSEIKKWCFCHHLAGGSGTACSGGGSRRMGGQPRSDQFVMKIPNNKVGQVIGKGSVTINSMQATTGARIQQLESVMQWCLHNRDDLVGQSIAELLHGKMVVLGLESEERIVRRLMSLYYKLDEDRRTSGLLFSRFLRTSSPKKRLMSIIHWCFDNLGHSQGRQKVMAIHANIVVLGLETRDVHVGMLISLYSRMAHDEDATFLIFERLKIKGVSAWTNVLFAYATVAPTKAITGFAEMEKTRITPSLRTFRALLFAHAQCNSTVEEAFEVLEKMRATYGLEPDVTHYGCLVEKLAKSRGVEEAIELVATVNCMSDHICGMIFGRCANSLPPDMESAEKMLDIVVREAKGKTYKVEFAIYMALKRGGLKWPRCVRRGPRAPGVSEPYY